MKDKRTGYKIEHAKRELIRYFAAAEATSKRVFQDYYLNKAIEQEAIIKQLKGNGHAHT